MKTELLRENFIAAITEQLPQGTNLAKYLSALLYMGKEAVYRRLRGDVAFSFEEAAVISDKMDVSLDNIVTQSYSNSALFSAKEKGTGNPIDNYCAFLQRKIDNHEKIMNAEYSEIGSSANTIPSTLYFNYDNISKFSSYKWLYQFLRKEPAKPYSEMVIPERMRDLQRTYASRLRQFNYIYFVWDDQLFSNYVKDIDYFLKLKLLRHDDVVIIKEELLSMIDDVEFMAAKGEFENGNKIDIFISNTNLESTYTYIETASLHLCLIKIFTMDSIISRDANIFETFKEWIQSLRRVSILVSRSGELQRVNFFGKQRDIINSLAV